jgi:hypothetical protein
MHGPGAEEQEPGDVGRPDRVEVQLGVEGVAEPVGGQDVAAAVADVRRHIGHRLKDALDARPDPLLGRPATRPGRGVGRPGEVEQVPTLGLVQLQRSARASSTASETPPRFPRSRRV